MVDSTDSENGTAQYIELLESELERRGGVLDRHTRHFHDGRDRLSDEEWEEFRSEARERFDVDVDALADRGKKQYDMLDTEPLGEDEDGP
jgi:hypothetical protein